MDKNAEYLTIVVYSIKGRAYVMKKINVNHDDKDCIILVTEEGKYKFYYQPVGTNERLWLFDAKSEYKTVFDFFQKKGRQLKQNGFIITVREIYKSGKTSNFVINKILERMPGQIEYVLRERYLYEKECKMIPEPMNARKKWGHFDCQSLAA